MGNSGKRKSGAAFLALMAGSALLIAPARPALGADDVFAEEAPGEHLTRMVHSKSAQTPAVAVPVDKIKETADGEAVPKSSMTLKAGTSYCVPSGTAMNLKVTSASPNMGMKLLQKDLEGNPIPARLGDVITATISEDIYVDGDRVIPEGTVFRGHVVHINGPRRVQRPGWVDINFDELELPNHRIFRFFAQADNLEASTTKSKLRGTGMVAANVAGGAIVGAIGAYQLMGGMRTAIACHGYNVAAGAALGGVLASAHAMMKRGHRAWMEPGDGLNLKIDTDMVLPALQAPTKHVAVSNNLEGVEIDVLKSKCMKNGIGGYYYRMDLNITNDSDKTLQAIDLYLVDSNGTKNPISMGPEGDEGSSFLFRLEPNSTLRTRVYFAAEYPKLSHSLVWFDHHNRFKVCYRKKLDLKPM